jgi:putative transposase
MIEPASPYVHYYNRGVNKDIIFFSPLQYEFLIQTLYRFLPNYRLELIAYCLMPNHYHILLRHDDLKEGSKYIQRVFNTFTQAVNHQVSRVGTLFQGNVKKRFVEDDGYLAAVIMYIHLNPVKSGLCNNPEEWLYSDYREWIGLKSSIRNIASERKQIFGSVEDYLDLINLEIQANRI